MYILVSSMSFHGSIANFFLVLNNIPLSVYDTVYLYSSNEGHFGSFRVLLILNKDAVNL